MTYTTFEAARELGMKTSTFRCKANTVGIVPSGSRNLFTWSDDQLDVIRKYKRRVSTNFFRYSKKNINIIEFYLTHRHNTQIDIANSMGLSVSKVNRALTEFLDTGHIIVGSKMNVDNFK